MNEWPLKRLKPSCVPNHINPYLSRNILRIFGEDSPSLLSILLKSTIFSSCAFNGTVLTKLKNRLMYKNLTVSIIASIDGNNNWEYNEFLYNIQNSLYNPNVRYILLEYFPAGRISVNGEDTSREKANVKVLQANNVFVEQPLPDANIFDRSVLIDFFDRYVLGDAMSGSRYDSKDDNRHFLITWGHGAGLGFFKERQPLNAVELFSTVAGNVEGGQLAGKFGMDQAKILKANLSVDFDIKNKIGLKKGLAVEVTQVEANDDYRMLDAVDLKEVLLASFFTRYEIQIEIFFAMNCYMQSFESGYALSEAVYYFFTSQVTMRFAGFDYFSLFMLFSLNHNISRSWIRENVFENLPVKYNAIKNSPNYAEYKTLPLSVSFNKLSSYHSMHTNVLVPLCDFLERNFDQVLANGMPVIIAIVECRALMTDLNGSIKPIGFVDFFDVFSLFDTHIFKNLSKNSPKINIASLWRSIEFVKSECKMYCTTYEFSSDNRKVPKMFSVFFPNFKDEVDGHVLDLLNSLETTKSRNRWSEFVLNVMQKYNLVKP